MVLFENERINISEITGVYKYNAVDDFNGKRIANYRTNGNQCELIYCLSGSNIVHFNGKTFKESSGSIRYLPNGLKINTGEYFVEREEYGSCIDIYFNFSKDMPEEAFCFKNMEFLKNDFVKIYNIWNSKKMNYYIDSMKAFYNIISQFRRNVSTYASPKHKNTLEPAMDYISEHYLDSDFDYSACCAMTGLSYSFFKKIFIEIYKVPPSKYVRNLQIEHAKELLATNRFSITEVAEKCGFENIYYFSTVFKKETGLSPKKYNY